MISNAEVEQFIELVEQARSTLPAVLDEVSIRRAFTIDLATADTLDRFRNALWQLIRGAVVRPSAKEAINLRLLKSALFRRSRFFDDGSQYDVIPATILYGVNETYFVSLSESACWSIAIRAAFALDALSGCRPDRGDQRDAIVTDSARRWVQRGYRIRLDGQQFAFEDGEEARAAKEVDDMARRIGGQRLIYSAFTLLRDLGHFVDERFSIPRSATNIPVMRTTSSVPYGYLLQLAARHMRSTPRSCPQELFTIFVDQITDLVALLDVETFSAWAQVFTDHTHLPRYIQVATLSDFCLNIRQVRPGDALHMIEHLFQWVPPEAMHARHGWTISEALRVARICLKPDMPWPVNVQFQVENIGRAAGLPFQVAERIRSSFTHRTDQLNAGFTKPTDAEACNFYWKPFIWQPGGKVLMTAPSVAAVGFIEAMLDAARAVDKQADNKTGLAIESLLAESFRRQGIEPTAASLKYALGKRHFDCDLLIETPDTILLFEVKKKSLRNVAMAGSSLDALIDLCLAMVKAQTQLMHHELQLAGTDGITFENGLRVDGRDRRVEKIAVTLLDWGGVQDRMVSDTILKLLAGASISAEATTDWQKKKLVECNELLQLVIERAKQLSLLKGVVERQPFFDCTFLGVPQILFMLDGANTAEEFVARLRTFKHTSVATLDMYRSQRYVRELHASQAALAEGSSVPAT